MLDTLQLMNFAAENEKLKAFSDFLKSENAKYNLTAVTDDKEIISKHFFDSLVGERFLEKGANVCDIGSGAGFPLIPLAVLRGDCSFTGVDSTQKKVNFINAACAMLDIKNCYAVHARAEEIKPRGSFSAVTARAVASLNTLCEYCLPALRVDGVMIAYKGSGKGTCRAGRQGRGDIPLHPSHGRGQGDCKNKKNRAHARKISAPRQQAALKADKIICT